MILRWDSTETYLQQDASTYTTRLSRYSSHGTWQIITWCPILDTKESHSMTQKGKEGESENAIGRIMALRWEPTHVTKHTSGMSPYRFPLLLWLLLTKHLIWWWWWWWWWFVVQWCVGWFLIQGNFSRLRLTGSAVFSCLDSYYLTDYCPN